MNKKPFKVWVTEEALRLQVSTAVIYRRFYRGKYPELKRVGENQRVIFVIPVDSCQQL